MGAESHRGGLDVELFQGERKTCLQGLDGLLEQRMVWTYALFIAGDHAGTTHVRVTRADGEVVSGSVSYCKPGTLIFRTHSEFGDPVRMPDDA